MPRSGVVVLFETIGAQVAGAMFAIVNAAVVTHSLVPADAGVFFIVIGIAAIGGIVGSFGASSSSAVFIGQSRSAQDAARERGSIEAILLLLAFINGLLLLFVNLMPLTFSAPAHWGASALAPIILPVSFQLIGISFGLGGASIFLALRHTRLAGWLRYAAPNALTCVFLCLMGGLDKATLYSILWCYAGGFLLVGTGSVFLALHFARRLCPRSVRPEIKSLLKVALPVTGAQVLVGLADYGVLWVAALAVSVEDIALLGVAQRVAMGCLTIFRVSTFLYMPIAARHFAGGKMDRLQSLSRVTGFLMAAPLLPLVLATLLWGGVILGRLFGLDYAPAWSLLAWLFIGYTARGVAGPGEFLLQIAGRQNTVLAFNALFLGCMMAGAYFLGAKFGALGVAISIAISFALLHILYFAICRWAYGLRVDATFHPAQIKAGLAEF